MATKSVEKRAGQRASVSSASRRPSGRPLPQIPLNRFQQLLSREALDAYLAPSMDEHINEYLPEENQRRQYLSGFTGSAGDLLVLADGLAKESAWLFVDSRYYEQADLEVDTTLIRISKLGLDGHPKLTDKLAELARSKPSDLPLVLGFDPFTLSWQMLQDLEKQLQYKSVKLKPVFGNLVDQIWVDRPSPCLAPVYGLAEKYTGRSAKAKITHYQKWLKSQQLGLMPLTKLDQIAWLLNLRGQDVAYNPVFMSYVIVTPETVLFFCDQTRIQKTALRMLDDLVQIHPYTDYPLVLRKLSKNKRVLLDPKHTTYGTYLLVTQSGGEVISTENPVENDKAVKNNTELHWMQEAHVKSGRGKIRAFYWLEQQLATGKLVTEKSFADQLEKFYAEEEGYKGLSFNTISGYGPNSSIVHYGACSDQVRIGKNNLFLVDSGVQYLGGTTDDTRTITTGKPTKLQIQRFTEVLKAHINCAMQIFPKGTEGARLDGITRATLWQRRLDYGHGTGHGVGAFLNVHEGPQGIHRLASKPLQPGMIVSIEPGYYEPSWGGIRCENLYVVIEVEPGWYGFQTLTYIPFDLRLVDWKALSKEQANWLKQYHQDVVRMHSKHLSKKERAWLKRVSSASSKN